MESSSTPAMDRRPSTPFSIESNPDQEFRLRWNNYQANLAQVFDQLLQSESFVDVTLTTDEGQSLKCHKVMLSACSPYFQQLFMENPFVVLARCIEFHVFSELFAVVQLTDNLVLESVCKHQYFDLSDISYHLG